MSVRKKRQLAVSVIPNGHTDEQCIVISFYRSFAGPYMGYSGRNN